MEVCSLAVVYIVKLQYHWTTFLFMWIFMFHLSVEDVVLGVQLLRTLGLVLADYSKLTWILCGMGKKYNFKDISRRHWRITTSQVKRLEATRSIEVLNHLQLHENNTKPEASTFHLLYALNKTIQFSSKIHKTGPQKERASIKFILS